jgi:hypothetical protein
MTEVMVYTASVRVDGRHRTDLGDIARLAASIKAEGLINPITITPDSRLLAGERRLAAVRLLGRDKIEARIVDTLNDAATELRLERDENTERKPMTKSELVALGRALEALERPLAAARQGTRNDLRRTSSPEEPEVQPASTREVVAAALGMSESTYQRAKHVVDAAADTTLSNDERAIAAEALSDMDNGGSVSASYDRIKTGTTTRIGAIPTTTIESAAAQRQAISKAATALDGIRHGLKQITVLHPDITNEEAAHWVDSLSDSRRVITTLINILKERTNARQP